MEPEKDDVLTALRQTIDEPTLAKARALESVLRRVGMPAKVFGRLNQKSSIDAAAESDRGITERIAHAFDASVTAARRLSGMQSSDTSLTPRNAAQRFLNPDRDACDWRPVEKSVDFGKPCIQFWPEDRGLTSGTGSISRPKDWSRSSFAILHSASVARECQVLF